MAFSLLSVFGFNIVKPNTTFTATTYIKPITSFEFDKYSLFNATGIFEVKRKSLLNLYIEQIEEGSLLETAVDKFNLINKDDFESENEYKDAVEKFASEIEVLKPIKERNKTRLHHLLKAEYDDKGKLKKLTNKNEKLLLDGSHSLASATNLYNYLKKVNTPIYGVWGMQKNKMPANFLKKFNGLFKKIITVKIKSGSSKQYSSLLLELNLVRKAWRPYGVDLQLSASGLKNILKWGTKVHGSEKTGPTSNPLE